MALGAVTELHTAVTFVWVTSQPSDLLSFRPGL